MTSRIVGGSQKAAIVLPTLHTKDQKQLPREQSGFVFDKSDLALVETLDAYGTIRHQPLESNFEMLYPEKAVQATFMKMVQRYPSRYSGRTTPESIHGCQVVAGKLRDQYDLKQQQFIRYEYLPHDYLGTIAREVEANRTLITFDESWVLAGIRDYINGNLSEEMTRTIRLREKMAVIQNQGFSEVSDLFGEAPDLSSLAIYQFEKMFMVFGPVTTVEASKIQLYLNRNIKLYDSNAYLVIKNMSLESALDLQHLYPVEISFMGNYLVLSSDTMTLLEIERIYHFSEVEFTFPRLEELRGAYAAYLTSEALFYEFSIRWENRKLYIGLAGYIQAKDISEQFANILTEVNREISSFKKFNDYRSSVEFCQKTNAKAFYHMGDYYAAIGPKTDGMPGETFISIQEVGQIEAMDPMRAIVHPKLGAVTRNYLRQLGYIVIRNPDLSLPVLTLGYRTYEIVGETFTIYFYKSTYNGEMEVYEDKGGYREEVKNRLEDLLNRGFFFTQRMKNLLRAYPGFIPGDSPIQRFPQALDNFIQETERFIH